MVRRTARIRPDATAAELAAFCGCSIPTVRRHLAGVRHHINTTPPPTTRSVTGVPKTVHPTGPAPAELLYHQLYGDDLTAVREILEHPAATGAMLRRAAAAGPAQVHIRVRPTITHHDNTPPAVLALFTESPDSTARSIVATHTRTPNTALRRLAGDSDSFVRNRLSRNPACPPMLLAVLAADPATSVRCNAVANRSCPRQVIAAAAAGDDIEMCRSAAANPSCPPQALAGLAGHPEGGIRTFVAGNPATSVDTLTRLADDDNANVRFAAAANPNTPPDVIDVLSRDRSQLVAEQATLHHRHPSRTAQRPVTAP